MIDAARRFADILEGTAYASRLGVRVSDIAAGSVSATVPYADELANAQGFVHGGVAASLAVWSALVATVASDRDETEFAAPVSASVSYLATARREQLVARAEISSRGRDLAHVRVRVAGEDDEDVALALLVMRRSAMPSRPAETRATTGTGRSEAAPAPPQTPESGRRGLISPFSKAMGMIAHRYDGASAMMTMPADINAGAGGAIDPGALIAMSDTCAALACLPSIDDRMLGSATLSLSVVFGAPLFEPAKAVGRSVARDGEIMSALIEIGADDDAARPPAMTACVSYRFLAAAGRG